MKIPTRLRYVLWTLLGVVITAAIFVLIFLGGFVFVSR